MTELTSTLTAPTTRHLPRPAAFWLLGTILVAFMFAAGAPSPLYVVYQARWDFSATTLDGDPGPRTTALPRCETSKMPTEVRTAVCSATTPAPE